MPDRVAPLSQDAHELKIHMIMSSIRERLAVSALSARALRCPIVPPNDRDNWSRRRRRQRSLIRELTKPSLDPGHNLWHL